MKLIWSGPALRDRKRIILYIAERNASAALKLLDGFADKAASLGQFPCSGVAGRVSGTRELVVHKHYILVYEVAEDSVIILAVLHTSRQYPPVEP